MQKAHEISVYFVVCLTKQIIRGEFCVHLVLNLSKKSVEKMKIESTWFETDLVMIGFIYQALLGKEDGRTT